MRSSSRVQSAYLQGFIRNTVAGEEVSFSFNIPSDIGDSECQVADWKTGNPPHKAVCGKPEAFFEMKMAPNNVPKSKWNPPLPGFQRSPALLHQMRILDENPDLDYILMRPYPHDDHGLAVRHPMKTFFTLNVNRAVTSGDKAAVKNMYNILAPTAASFGGMCLEDLKKQLQNEYGVDVTQVT